LTEAIEDPEYDKLDTFSMRSRHNYALDGLWLMATIVALVEGK